MKNPVSFILGFLLLFSVYHFPEFFSAFWITAVFKIGFLLVAVLISRLQGWKALEGYGLRKQTKGINHLFWGLIIGFLAFVSTLAILFFLNIETLQSIKSPLFFLKTLPAVLFITFFPSIAEDILTRGYLLGHLTSLKPVHWIMVSALVYVLNHIWRLHEGISVIVYLFALGLLLGLCVYVYKSLWLAFGIHWGSNIAYELSRQGITSQNNDYNFANWVLAIVWTFLLLIFIIKYYRILFFPSKNKQTPIPNQ